MLSPIRTSNIPDNGRRMTRSDSARSGSAAPRNANAANSNSPAAAGPAGPAFQTSLWDAFRGTPAPAATIPSPVKNSPSAKPSATDNSGVRGGAVTTGGSTRAAATAPTSASTATTTVARAEEAPAPPDPNTVFLNRVIEALQSIGLDPNQIQPRIGSIEIVFPGKPTYDYPVMWANVGGQQTPFYLQAAMQNPGMVAINISGMLGRPIMHLI